MREHEAFEIGSRVQPYGGGLVVGEIIEFVGERSALVRWDNGDEAVKAIRNLELIRRAALQQDTSNDR